MCGLSIIDWYNRNCCCGSNKCFISVAIYPLFHQSIDYAFLKEWMVRDTHWGNSMAGFIYDCTLNNDIHDAHCEWTHEPIGYSHEIYVHQTVASIYTIQRMSLKFPSLFEGSFRDRSFEMFITFFLWNGILEFMGSCKMIMNCMQLPNHNKSNLMCVPDGSNSPRGHIPFCGVHHKENAAICCRVFGVLVMFCIETHGYQTYSWWKWQQHELRKLETSGDSCSTDDLVVIQLIWSIFRVFTFPLSWWI